MKTFTEVFMTKKVTKQKPKPTKRAAIHSAGSRRILINIIYRSFGPTPYVPQIPSSSDGRTRGMAVISLHPLPYHPHHLLILGPQNF
jgi:hypothetical protein